MRGNPPPRGTSAAQRYGAILVTVFGIVFFLAASSGPAPVRDSIQAQSAHTLTPASPVEVPDWGALEAFLAPQPRLRVGILPDASGVSIATEAGVVVLPLGEDGTPEGHGYPLSRASFVPAGVSGQLRLVETAAVLDSVAVVPAMPSGTLSADGAPYRGYLEVRPGEGTLSVVNVVNVEDYLRGVVPNELPGAGPQLEAMKAQAVAARTYALRQRGDYASKGYDLCATPACQVYRGRATEHPRADRAVAETRGLVAQYQGIPIKALYTSACGGHTEDIENVFVGERERPYLRGVACTSERAAGGRARSLSRDAALLEALDVLEPDMASASALQGLASDAELEAWTERLVGRTGRSGCASGAPEHLSRRGAFFAHIVDRLCWQGDPKESPGVTDARERRAVAFLVEEGILAIDPDHGLRPTALLTRGEAVQLLARSAERAWLPELVGGEFRGEVAGRLSVARVETEAEASYPLDDSVRVYGDLGEERPAAAGLGLSPGDPVRFVLRQGRVVLLEKQRPHHPDVGAETSARSWQVSLSPGEVARAVSRYGTLSDVRDLQLRRVGASGRVLEVAVIGDRQREELVLKGLEVRRGLGLRENFFVMDRDKDARGSVRRFVFTGKGWGHGVGLCQAGAVGMARGGAGFEQILTHYYTGVTLKKAY